MTVHVADALVNITRMRVSIVLGAGATLANALHFRSHRLQASRPPLDTTFFAAARALRLPLPVSLRHYLRRLTRTDPSPDVLSRLRMEEVFKDLYYDFLESPNSDELRRAYTDLVSYYVRVLADTTNWIGEDSRRGAPVGKLLASAADASSDLTVITFNHDLVIESEIVRRRRLARRWCLDHGYGRLSALLDPLFAYGGSYRHYPRFPVHSDNECDHTRPITILKLHGSLNWMVRLAGDRPTARTLSGQAAAKDSIYLLTAREAENQTARFRREEPGPGRRQWRMWPVIIPPVYAKQTLRQVIRVAWDEARDALEQADRVIFFGYSLPLIDIDAEKLFERSLARNRSLKWIDVIDPASAAALRYAGLAPALPVRWYPSFMHFRDVNGY